MIALSFGLAALFVGDLAWHRRRRWRPALLALSSGAAALCLGVAMWALPGGEMLFKVMGKLAMPAGILWSLLFAASFWAWHRRRVAPAAVGFAFWIGLTVAGNEVVGSRLLGSLERDYTSIQPLEEAPFDAVFVLGGGTRRLPGGAVQVSGAGDRVVLAARLHHRGVAPLLVASGSSIPGARWPRDLAEESLAIWTDLGVDEAAVVELPEPTDTSEEIAAYAKLARERGWERMGLVTSAWHMRRAMQRAAERGLEVTPLPADIRGGPVYSGLFSMIPSGRGFVSVQRAAWEYLGAAVGH